MTLVPSSGQPECFNLPERVTDSDAEYSAGMFIKLRMCLIRDGHNTMEENKTKGHHNLDLNLEV